MTTTRLFGPWEVNRGQPIQPGGIDVSNWNVSPDPFGFTGPLGIRNPATVQVTAFAQPGVGATGQLKVTGTTIEVANTNGPVSNVYQTTIQVSVQNVGTVPIPSFFIMISTVAAQ
jgi:hypothetical protein